MATLRANGILDLRHRGGVRLTGKIPQEFLSQFDLMAPL
jgi:hypothetical protein